MSNAKFEKAFLKAIRKHAGIKKQIEQKVLQIIEHPVELGAHHLQGLCVRKDFAPGVGE